MEAQVIKSYASYHSDSAHNPHGKRVFAVPKEFHMKADRKQGLVKAIVTEIAATYTQLFPLHNRNTLPLIWLNCQVLDHEIIACCFTIPKARTRNGIPNSLKKDNSFFKSLKESY